MLKVSTHNESDLWKTSKNWCHPVFTNTMRSFCLTGITWTGGLLTLNVRSFCKRIVGDYFSCLHATHQITLLPFYHSKISLYAVNAWICRWNKADIVADVPTRLSVSEPLEEQQLSSQIGDSHICLQKKWQCYYGCQCRDEDMHWWTFQQWSCPDESVRIVHMHSNVTLFWILHIMQVWFLF